MTTVANGITAEMLADRLNNDAFDSCNRSVSDEYGATAGSSGWAVVSAGCGGTAKLGLTGSTTLYYRPGARVGNLDNEKQAALLFIA